MKMLLQHQTVVHLGFHNVYLGTHLDIPGEHGGHKLSIIQNSEQIGRAGNASQVTRRDSFGDLLRGEVGRSPRLSWSRMINTSTHQLKQFIIHMARVARQ